MIAEKKVEDGKDEVLDVSRFEKSMLTKPSDLPSQQSANNMKMILQGKYFNHSCNNSDTNIQENARVLDGSSSVSVHPVISESIKNIDTVFHPSRRHFPLPPIHNHPPHKKPRKLHLVDLHLKLRDLLQIKSEFVQPEFQFDTTDEAAEFNWNLLSSNNFDLESILTRQTSSITSYGSEFKLSSDLESLLQHHPRWPALRTKLDHGSLFPLAPIPEDTRSVDLESALVRGNHKSAIKNNLFLAKAIQKETKKGWLLCLPEDKYKDIPGLTISPMGIAEQVGVTASGEFAAKLRVTHDLSFPGAHSLESINSRVIKDSLEPCMFGHALIRIIHYIVNIRSRYPSKKIWIRKEDFKSAYRRMHVNAETSFKSAVCVEINGKNYLFLSLRLPFGGSPCPNDFCLLSDIITDTINDLLSCKEWNWKEIHSEFLAKIPDEVSLDASIPISPAIGEMSVTLPVEDHGKADVFVDDIISIAPDINDNLQRLKAASCTVIHAISNTASSSSTSIPRDDMIADDKNEAEGAPEEIKITLGWSLDTRRLLVKLPFHKWKAWRHQISSTLKGTAVDRDTLASIVGRLENVAIIIKMMGHFLNNIRYLLTSLERSHKNIKKKITKRARDDLVLSLSFLDAARDGISMNLIVFRSPSIIHIGDASEHGMGAFASHGRAWRYLIPNDLRGRAHINLLEFLTQVISVWIDILEGSASPMDCILCMGDSTTAMGWMRRSNFRESDDDGKDEESQGEWLVKQQVARKLASLTLDSNTMLYQQWFKGEENVVADSLSRDLYYLSPKTHEKFLSSVASPQLPQNFHIKPVPEEICSFITSILQQLPVKKRRLIPQKPSETALGNVGILSDLALESRTASTSMECQDLPNTSSSQLSHKQSEKLLSHQDITDYWWKAQSMPPHHMWHRPSGQTTGLTPDWTSTVRSASYYKNNIGAIEMKTDLHGSSEPCHFQS